MADMFGQLVEMRWRRTLMAVSQIGGSHLPLQIDSPATEREIEAIEGTLGFRLPSSFRDTLLQYSRQISFRWFLPDDYELSDKFSQIFCGNCHWSLDFLVQFNEEKDDWIKKVFPDPTDPYDRVWHEKFVFYEVGNGDYLSIDLKEKGNEEVTYLSHGDGEGHGKRMGANFEDFILRWTRLACVGGEDWQWLPFARISDGYLDPDCENSHEFRKLLTLGL